MIKKGSTKLEISFGLEITNRSSTVIKINLDGMKAESRLAIRDAKGIEIRGIGLGLIRDTVAEDASRPLGKNERYWVFWHGTLRLDEAKYDLIVKDERGRTSQYPRLVKGKYQLAMYYANWIPKSSDGSLFWTGSAVTPMEEIVVP